MFSSAHAEIDHEDDGPPSGLAQRAGGPRTGRWPFAPMALAALISGILAARAGVGDSTPAAAGASGPPTLTALVGSPALFGLACAALVAAALTRGRGCMGALLLAAALIGAGAFTLRTIERRADDLSAWAQSEPDALPIIVEGVVLTTPAVDPGAPDRQTPGRGRGPTSRFDLDIESVETPSGSVPATGRLRVFVRDEVTTISAGDRLRLRGEWRPVRGPINPGESDERLWAGQEGRAGSVSVAAADLLTPLPPRSDLASRATAFGLRGLAALRAGAARWLETALDGDDPEGTFTPARDPARAMLGALLIGREDRSLEPVSDAFTRLGLVHILSISGFHLVVLAGLVGLLIRLTGDRGVLEPVLVATVVLIYLLVVPAEAPVLRSGIMVLVFLAAECAGRRYHRLNLLALIAAALLLWRPMDLFAPGFQLSFMVTGALIAFAEPLRRRWFEPRLRGGVSRQPRTVVGMFAHWVVLGMQGGLSASVLAWGVSAPIVLYHAGLLSPAAPVTGFVLTFVFTGVMWAGSIALALVPLSAALAWLAGRVLAWLAGFATWACLTLDGLPGMAIGLPRVSEAWTIGAVVTAFAWLRGGWSTPGFRTRRWLASTLVLGWLAVTLALASRAGPDEQVSIAALAGRRPGPHPAHLVRAGDQAVLVLGTTATEGEVRRSVPRTLRALDAWRVRSVVLAEGCEAAGALPELAARIGLSDVHVPAGMIALARERPGSEAGLALAACEQRGVRVHATGSGAGGRITLTPRVALEAGGPDPTLILGPADATGTGRPAEIVLRAVLEGATARKGADGAARPRFGLVVLDGAGRVIRTTTGPE
ncbi:MAG: ComEC/Rec2 family competence protein [Phycisphaerales bacterium]